MQTIIEGRAGGFTGGIILFFTNLNDRYSPQSSHPNTGYLHTIYIIIYIYIHIHTYTHIHIHIHTHITPAYIYMQKHLHKYTLQLLHY